MISTYDIIQDRMYLRMAREYSTMSPDPSTKVGSVVVRDKEVLGLGYNHIPYRHMSDVLHDREKKYARVIHAEMHACIGKNVTGSTVYGYPIFSCERCVAHMRFMGVSRIVSTHRKGLTKYNNVSESKIICEEARISYTIYNEKLLDSLEIEKLDKYVDLHFQVEDGSTIE